MNRIKIIVCVINLILSLIVMYLVYDFFYKKNALELNDRKEVFNRFCHIENQLDDFVNIQTRMDEESKSINENIAKYSDVFLSNEENINSYKEKITKLLKDGEIPIEKDSITQISNSETDVSFKLKIIADYQQLCKFLFEIERYSIISEISMDYLGKVEITVKPILYSSEVNDCFSGRSNIVYLDDDIKKIGYFKEIFDKILEVKNVGYIQSWRDFEPIPKDPFYQYISIKQKQKEKEKVSKKLFKKVVVVPKPTFVLDGILYEKDKPIVIIGGKFYYVGDVFEGYKIIKINESTIVVSRLGTDFVVKMEN